MKQKFYNIKRLLEVNAEYNMLLGERSNGKSYAIKEMCITDAYNNGNEFIYLRRWQLETKPTNVEYYFKDAPVSAITNGEYDSIIANRGKIYLASFDIETNAIQKKKLIGHIMYLSGETHFRSFSYPKVKNIIFEEFVTIDGYLPRECDRLMQLVSTVARRNKIQVWMIGNTISRLNPYFSEWGLRNIPNQKQGTIETYKFETDQQDENGNKIIITIAVEFCANSGNNSRMFFGKSTEMITSGAWQTKNYPHLEKSRSEYTLLYSVLIEHLGLSVCAELLTDGKYYIAHVYPKPKKNIRRVISDGFSLSKWHTNDFTVITRGDAILFDLIKKNKVVMSDNLTGSDFESIIKAKGGL